MKRIITIVTCLLSVRAGAQDSTKAKLPFDGMDLSWVNGQNRQTDFPLQLKDKSGNSIVTGVAYLDTYFNYNFADPKDHTQTISSTMGRTNEFTLNLTSIGIETNYKNIIGRLWLQYGQMGSVIQELDGTVSRGRNTAISNLKNIREAAAGYHFNKWYGVNVEMGIFMSYIGLESYVTQENWSYQRSMVCDFTPFYFSGARLQVFPTKKFKTELWLLNGWQTYNSWSRSIGVGSSNYYRPNENTQLVANFYFGKDTRNSNRTRFHHDNSIVKRYYHRSTAKGLSQAAFSINTHYGFQDGDGVKAKDQYMAGTSIASRLWFLHNKLGFTTRADIITNPGLYLAFTPSAVTPNDFTDAMANDPKQKLNIFQATATFDVMPNDLVTFRLEYGYRHSNVPYFTGKGGSTSPDGWVDTPLNNWRPDLRRTENRITLAVNFRL
ncbi:MAG: outer membrane beta-barrel protein [Ferruginibacter sp.]